MVGFPERPECALRIAFFPYGEGEPLNMRLAGRVEGACTHAWTPGKPSEYGDQNRRSLPWRPYLRYRANEERRWRSEMMLVLCREKQQWFLLQFVEVLNEFPAGLCGRIKPIALLYLLRNILADQVKIFLARRSSRVGANTHSIDFSVPRLEPRKFRGFIPTKRFLPRVGRCRCRGDRRLRLPVG